MSKLDPFKRITPREPKIAPALPAAVPPALRFMLSDEARAQAGDMDREVSDRICWSNVTGDHRVPWVEKHLVGKLAERWPLVAQADAAVDGLLTEVLRAYAVNAKLPGWWRSPLIALTNGHPEKLRSSCERVLSHAGVPFEPAAPYAEETPDPVMLTAARHWQDRDVDECEDAD